MSNGNRAVDVLSNQLHPAIARAMYGIPENTLDCLERFFLSKATGNVRLNIVGGAIRKIHIESVIAISS